MMRNQLLGLVIAGVVLALLPYAFLFVVNQGPYSVPPEFMDDTIYYLARTQAVVSGHPFIGNPYFKEHANETASAFFGADWIAAVPLLFGVSPMVATLINVVLGASVFIVLAFLLFRELGIAGWKRSVAVFAVFLVSFWYLERPVAMQIVFPAFLLVLVTFIVWLKNPNSRKAQVAFMLSAGLSFYLYTYLWQIVLVIGAGAHLVFLTKKKNLFKSLLIIDVGVILVALPMIFYTKSQLLHPWYWETVRRIGFIETHTFGLAGLWVALLLSVCVAALYLVRKRISFPHRVFFGVILLALLGTSFSNVITGKDLETAVHAGRFVELFTVITMLYVFAHAHACSARIRLVIQVLIIGIYVLLLLPSAQHALKIDSALLAGEAYAEPMAWLREHAPEGSVILADDAFSYYVPALTRNYVLFQPDGGLYLISDEEMKDRFLVSRIFSSVNRSLLEDKLRLYAGVGNAVHAYKIQNREYRICLLVRIYACDLPQSAVGILGTRYFDLLENKNKQIREHMQDSLSKFAVDYVVKDTLKDTDFHVENLPYLHKEVTVGRFEIYTVK